MVAVSAPAPAADLTFVSQDQQDAARIWINRNDFPTSELMSRPVAERAKAALFATYRFCDAGDETYSDLNSLYDHCSTQCGGFSYFYRGLAKVLGVESRFFRIYNIPNQGNHVAVEVNLGGQWGFVDPTFGAYFEGESGPMSFSVIASALTPSSLAQHVRQADKSAPLSEATDLDQAFSATYDHTYMPITNYQVAEAATTDDPNELLALRIQIAAGSTIGDFEATDRKALSDGWLAYTNATLNDDAPLNDTSYNAAQLFNNGLQKLAILEMTGLAPNASASVDLRFFNPGEAQEIQISSLGKELQLGMYGIVQVPPGASTIQVGFRSRADHGEIFVRSLAPLGLVELFAVRAQN